MSCWLETPSLKVEMRQRSEMEEIARGGSSFLLSERINRSFGRNHHEGESKDSSFSKIESLKSQRIIKKIMTGKRHVFVKFIIGTTETERKIGMDRNLPWFELLKAAVWNNPQGDESCLWYGSLQEILPPQCQEEEVQVVVDLSTAIMENNDRPESTQRVAAISSPLL
jgi:hypothetical protein